MNEDMTVRRLKREMTFKEIHKLINAEKARIRKEILAANFWSSAEYEEAKKEYNAEKARKEKQKE